MRITNVTKFGVCLIAIACLIPWSEKPCSAGEISLATPLIPKPSVSKPPMPKPPIPKPPKPSVPKPTVPKLPKKQPWVSTAKVLMVQGTSSRLKMTSRKNPVTAARERAKNALKEKEREIREAAERKAREAKEALEREARELKEAADRKARDLRVAREAAEQKRLEAERTVRKAKEDAERKAQEVKERLAREAADAAEIERKLRAAAEMLKREAPARLAENVKDELRVAEAAGERLANGVQVETEETLESIKRSKSVRAAAVEFDKRRIDALNDFSEQSKHAGNDIGDDAKKAGAIVSNTWKMYNGDLDRLHGWLRANAKAGDIVACGNVWNGDCGEWGHIAIVTDPEKELLYESAVGEGVHETEWATLAKHYVKIALYRVKNVEEQDAKRVVEWVKTQDGKPYRMPIIDGTDKNNDNRMYCSQLIWIAYKRTLDIDLHGNGSPIIHPDEMLRNPNMILQKKARKW